MKIRQQTDHHDLCLLSPKDARKMLGVYTAPDGNTNKQATILRQKSLKWSNSLRNRSLHQYEALLSYHHGIMKSLEYPLGPGLLSEQQCHQAQSPALSTVLQKSGLISTLSREVVHGPHKYGGLNFPNLYIESGIQKLRLLLGHIRKQDKTGEILNVAQGCVQQEVGISTPILDADFTKYGHTCSPSWFHHLWSFLSSVDGTVRYPASWAPASTFSKNNRLG